MAPEAEADSSGTPSQPIIHSPQSPPPSVANDNDDIITAICIAQIRITSAQKWYQSSLVMFERAKAQVELSQRELKDATDYLERLNSLSSSSSSLAVAKGINSIDVAKEGDEEDINLMSSLSGESVDKLELKKSTSSGGTEQTATSETVVSENNNVAAVAVNQGSSSTEISSGVEEERNFNKLFKNLPVGGVVGSENDVAKSISTNTEGDVLTDEQPSMQVEEEIVSLAVATAVCDSYNTLFNEDEPSQIKETESKSADAASHPLSPLSIVSSDSVDSEDKKDEDKVLLDTSNRDEEVDIYLENDAKEIPTVSPLRKKFILNRAQSDEEFLSVLSETSDKTFEEDNTDANADIDTSFQRIISTIPECNEVYLMGCDGIPELNGRYSKFAISDDVPTYSKIAKLDGQEVICTISRWQANNGTRKWYITATVPGGGDKANHIAFYVTYDAPAFLNRPPRKSWMKCVDGEELFLSPEYSMRGVDPPPIISIESEGGNSLRSGPGLLGRQISTALKSGSSIASSGSSNSSSKRRRRKEQQEKKSLGSLGSSVSTSKSAKNADEVPSSVYLPPSLLR